MRRFRGNDGGTFRPNYEGEKKIVTQMLEQSVAAGGRLVEWHFAEERVADYFEVVVKTLGLSNMIVRHTAPLAGAARSSP